MPIYAYRCESCGFEKDVLQKISDAHLTQCPSCGADAFRKQVTAAGFQLKGSGWYVTDFRGGNSGGGSGGNGAGTSAAATGAKAAGDSASASSPEASKPAGDSAASSTSAGASTTPSTAGAT
ncbi:FmdB family zinc ribbon protein [Paraburkholderia adhaesiva]|uniref:FmdB family zinc ribbon protein n=1 Tax=Paraburkholderia adhaesiva TaxID=2883244 RepID=UPI001F1CDF33|nr:FmdB family zinc ribbon protein [Paraburkholderia adhaesiva]